MTMEYSKRCSSKQFTSSLSRIFFIVMRYLFAAVLQVATSVCFHLKFREFPNSMLKMNEPRKAKVTQIKLLAWGGRDVLNSFDFFQQIHNQRRLQ